MNTYKVLLIFLSLRSLSASDSECVGLGDLCNEDCECCDVKDPQASIVKCERRIRSLPGRRCYKSGVIGSPCIRNDDCRSQYCLNGICKPHFIPKIAERCPLRVYDIEQSDIYRSDTTCRDYTSTGPVNAIDNDLMTDFVSFTGRALELTTLDKGSLRTIRLCNSKRDCKACDPSSYILFGFCSKTKTYEKIQEGKINFVKRKECITITVKGMPIYSKYKISFPTQNGSCNCSQNPANTRCPITLSEIYLNTNCAEVEKKEVPVCSNEIKYFALGEVHTCVVNKIDQVYCWGGNFAGEQGYEDLNNRFTPSRNPVDIGSVGMKIEGLFTGAQNTCVLLETKDIKCWGLNSSGDLGYENNKPIGAAKGTMGDNLKTVKLGEGRKVKTISMGLTHTCAILENDSLKCWGSNGSYQLGYGDKLDRGGPGTMGDNLPIIGESENLKVKQVSIGFQFTCIVLFNDKMKCWGLGVLGYGDTITRSYSSSLPYIDVGGNNKVAKISAMYGSICALLTDETVKCWGSNSYGALGQGDSISRGGTPNDMGDKLPPIDFGKNKKVKQIAGEHYTTCVLLSDNTVKCFGLNWECVTGIGDDPRTTRGAFPNQMGDHLPPIDFGSKGTVKEIQLHYLHACAKFADNSLACWGGNIFGNLGIGHAKDVGCDLSDMGNNLKTVNLCGK